MVAIALMVVLLVGAAPNIGWTQEAIAPATDANVSESAASEHARSPSEQARLLLDQGYKHYWNSEFADALEVWHRALDLYRQLDALEEQALVLEGLGLAYEALGDCPTALDYQQQRYEVAEVIGDPIGEGNALANMGNCYYNMGRYQEGLEALRQSLAHWKQLGDRGRQAAVMANIGNVYTELGHYDEAATIHRASLEILQDIGNHWGVAASLNSLGLIAASQGEAEQAYRYYERSLEQFRALGHQPAVGQLLNNLGTVYHQQGETEIALDYYQQSLEVAEALGDRALEGDSIIGIGLIYTQQENYEAAIEIQRYGVELARSRGDMRLVGLGLTNLADTLWLAGELDKAEELLLEAIDVLDSLRSELNDRDRISIFDTQLMAYNILQEVLVEKGDPEAALEVAERGRARAFVQLLAERMETQSGAAPTEPDAAAATDSISEALRMATPTVQDIRRIAQQLDATLVQYSILPDSRFLSLGKLRGDDARLFIWVVKPSGDITFHAQDLQSLSVSLADLVRGSRNTLTIPQLPDRATSLTQSQLLHELYQLLIQPIAADLPTDASDRVILIPQNQLFLTPFPALLNAEGTYLIEQHTLLTAPSIQVLDLAHQQVQQRQSDMPPWQTDNWANSPDANPHPMLIVGNPVMPSISTSPTQPPEPLAALPAAEQEARNIARLLNAEPLIGAAATEAAVIQQMSQARLIHLATHGLLDYGQSASGVLRDIPGAIALAPSPNHQIGAADTDIDAPMMADGLLTAAEILDMQLRANLVVLSACNTGRGDITGDGVIGLSRSLMSAGVPSVVVSLWAVPDASTSELMLEFYRQLQQSPDKAYALRQAMLDTFEAYPSPLNWAAFTLVGSP